MLGFLTSPSQGSLGCTRTDTSVSPSHLGKNKQVTSRHLVTNPITGIGEQGLCPRNINTDSVIALSQAVMNPPHVVKVKVSST